MSVGGWGNGGVVHWNEYDPCTVCGVGSGRACISRRYGRRGNDKLRPHPGRTRGLEPDRCMATHNTQGLVWFCLLENGHRDVPHIDSKGRTWRSKQPSLT